MSQLTAAQRHVLERLSLDGQVLRTPWYPSRSWMLGNGDRVRAAIARSLIDAGLIEPKVDRERYVITPAGRVALASPTRTPRRRASAAGRREA